MSSIDLFLLGFLYEKPWSAYELTCFVAEHQLGELVKVSTPAIYKNILRLANRGFLNSRTEKNGEMPEKKVYSITENGEEYFYELVEESFKEKYSFNFPFNSAIINLDKLKKKKAIKLMKILKKRFTECDEYYREMLKEHISAPLEERSLMSQHQILNRALLNWIENIIDQYKNME